MHQPYAMEKTDEDSLNNSSSPETVASGLLSSNLPVPGISAKTWDKFRQLQKRREEQSLRSTARRVDEIKADVAAKIKEQFSNDDEMEALQRHNVDLSQLDSRSMKRKRKASANLKADECANAKKTNTDTDASTDFAQCAESSQLQSEWLAVKRHLNVNSHLAEETGGSDAPKSHLERAINLAVAADEFELAENLSDRLANRDFGNKIAAAFDAKRFIDKRKHEEEVRKANKKKKLAWGFVHKQRWETKGNM